ncbi:family 1 extracellular solute-binding protein [Caldibacillus thermoamylovorans]|uniref:Family 1 extracellular solute-binding protein n=1 Tax=Caldibacillus thermoamylovorans TaxID=35841 RepID=A0A090KNT5_9BACI|nr:ABC transporter substrate-binding protein [Caldibacillus thermoamylovorans]CEE00324.1 family 1 extracellular solute-binding protein [Caldibacillus thermoamylovorans]
MKFKRVFLPFLLILTLLITGCSFGESSGDGEGSSKNGKTKVTFWTPFSGTDGEFMTEMVKKFNESQDEIEVEVMNNVWDDYYTKLKTSIVSNTSPDLAVAHVSRLGELIPTGKLQQIDDLAKKAGIDWSTFGKNQFESVKRDGKTYAIPLDTHAVIMFYNNKYLRDAGVLNEAGNIKMEPGAEGFTNLLRTLKQKLPEDVHPMVIGSNNVFTFWIWHALVAQQGGSYITDGKATIDTPEGKKAMELLTTWLDEGLMPVDIGDNSYDIFKEQKAAITFTGVWATGNFEKESSLDFSAVDFPQLFDHPAAWGDSHTLVIPTQENKDKQLAAAKFANWVTENGVMWAKAGHVPSKTTVVESEEFKATKYRPKYADVMKSVAYMPYSDKLTSINDAILESLVEINYGHMTIEEGLAEAQKKVEDLLKK